MVYLIMIVSSIILRLLILELEIKATSHDRIDRVTKNIKKQKKRGQDPRHLHGGNGGNMATLATGQTRSIRLTMVARLTERCVVGDGGDNWGRGSYEVAK